MGYYREKEYYDDIFSRYEKYHGHYSNSEYFKMWKIVIGMLQEINNPQILEIGCGTGQFADMLYDNGFSNYDGFDFSEVAVTMAKNRTPFSFMVADALEKSAYETSYNTVIALEVFEHTDDYKILKNIKSGTNIIISVPDFDDPAHLRYFGFKFEVYERYKNHIEIETIEKHEHWFILKGVVR